MTLYSQITEVTVTLYLQITEDVTLYLQITEDVTLYLQITEDMQHCIHKLYKT